MRCEYMTDILFKAVDGLLKEVDLHERKVVMFGLNAPAFVCKQYLQDRGIETFAFVDNSDVAIEQFNSPDVTPTRHHLIGDRRIKAYRPEDLPAAYHDEYVFLIYSKYEKEMLSQLLELGYEEGKQAFLTGGFWKTEEIKRAYVPEGAGAILTPEEIREHQMSGLRYIHNLCEKHQLKYYLHYGTLLGAIRHKGYIPWDDDLDILMMNEEMLELLEIIKQENGRYGVFYAGFNDPVRHFIARIEDRETLYHQWDIPLETFGGMITVDIFPMGGMPKGEEEMFYNDVMQKAWEYDDLTVEFPNPDAEIQKRRAFCKRYVLDALAKYPASDSDYLFTIPTKPGRLIFDRAYWDEQILMDFEGEQFWGPRGYDGLLTAHYGDYMTPPPENRRVSIHRTTIYHKA